MKHMILQLHITGKCNLRCKHCYIAEHGGELSCEEVSLVLRQFSHLLQSMRRELGESVFGHVHVTGGEPFLHPQIEQILQLMLQHRQMFRYAIMSNGTALKHLRLVEKLNLKALQVSIDGDEAVHDAIRGKGNLAQVCNGLDILHSHDIRTRVSFTAHLDNYRLLPNVAKICMEHHVSSLWSDRYIPVQGSEIRPMDAAHMPEYVNLLRVLAHALEYKTAGLTIQNRRALQFLGGDETPYSCTAGESLIVVDENGDIFPCRRLPIVCGNIRETNLDAVYHGSAVFKDLRRHEVTEKCIVCLYREKCRGGLRCMTYASCGEYLPTDPCCYQ